MMATHKVAVLTLSLAVGFGTALSAKTIDVCKKPDFGQAIWSLSAPTGNGANVDPITPNAAETHFSDGGPDGFTGTTISWSTTASRRFVLPDGFCAFIIPPRESTLVNVTVSMDHFYTPRGGDIPKPTSVDFDAALTASGAPDPIALSQDVDYDARNEFVTVSDGSLISVMDGDVVSVTGRFGSAPAGPFDEQHVEIGIRAVIFSPETLSVLVWEEVEVVPAPASAVLMGSALGLFAVVSLRRRRRGRG